MSSMIGLSSIVWLLHVTGVRYQSINATTTMSLMLPAIDHSLVSQAARQDLAVLMATAVVVQKHETSTTYQSHMNWFEIWIEW